MLKPKPKKKEAVKKKNPEKSYNAARELFTAIQRLLPKFGIPLDIPNIGGNGFVVRSKKAENHHYTFVMEMELANGTLTYGLQFTKSYPPEPHYAVETAVAFAVEGRFCFSVTLDAGQCGTADAEEVAGDIVQKFTACVMAHLRAMPFVEELRGSIADWAGKTKRRSPLTA